MALLLTLFLLILSCGGGTAKREIELRFTGGVVDAPYFTGVVVRVSGEDFEPSLFGRNGIFFPGDVVSINISIPEGPERHFEAFVYDHLGNPVYYGAKTVDVTQKSRIVIELHPSEAIISGYLRFYDGEVSADADVYIINEDLYIPYGPLGTSDGTLTTYLTGSYIAYLEDERTLRYSYSYSSDEVDIYLEGLKSYTVFLPFGERSLYLTGSYEGAVHDGDVIEVRTGRILGDHSIVLSGAGEKGFYFFIGSPGGGTVSTWNSTCVTFEEPDCLPLKLSFSGVLPEGFELYGVYRGIKFLARRGLYFWMNPELSYRLRLYGVMRYENCSYSWMLEIDLPDDFSGRGLITTGAYYVSVPEGIRGYFRVYGEGLEVEGFCGGGKVIKIPVFDSFPSGAFLEVEREGKRYGAVVSEGEVVFPEIDIEDVVVRPGNEVLYFSFRRVGDLADCELTLHGSNYRIHVDRIPPWRSYLKIRDLLGEGFGEAFGESPAGESAIYSLKCYTPQRDAYVLVGPFENIGLAEEPF